MNEITYEEKLEYKLIGEFKRLFYRKMGYEPVVISRNHIEIDPKNEKKYELRPVNLRILKQWFDEISMSRDDYKKTSIETKRRNREIVQLRMTYCFIAKAMGYSYVKIAKSLGRDHSTIIHNVNNFKNLLETNIQIRNLYKEVLDYIKEKIEKHDPKLLECSDQTQDNNEPTLLP